MARKLLVLVGVCLSVCLIQRPDARAEIARYELASAPQRSQNGARLKLRLTPARYDRVHVVLAGAGTSWDTLKKNPVPQGTILHDFGTHQVAPNQITEMNFHVPYGAGVQSGSQLVLAARFFTQGASYIHVWGGNSNDTKITMP